MELTDMASPASCGRLAIVEFKYSSDAEYGWRKLDKLQMDGRTWQVDWATPSGFKFFGELKQSSSEGYEHQLPG